jgi:hypothetical protein
MSKDIESILLINRYLTCCKLNRPESKISKIAQRYLTTRISNILNRKNENRFEFLYHLTLLPFLIFR